MPADHPDLPLGAPVYCSSSQAVKRRYRHDRPKPGLYRTRRSASVELTVTEDAIVAVGRCGPEAEARCTVTGSFTPARDASSTEAAARGAFEKLGDTGLSLAALTIHNPAGLFVPVSRLNQLRRDLAAELEAKLDQARHERAERVTAEFALQRRRRPREAFRWSVKVDRIGLLDAFTETDWADVDEVIVDITRDHPAVLSEKLDHWAALIGRERIRLALPPLSRKWEEGGLLHKMEKLRRLGWRRWEAANLSAWSYLGLDPTAGPSATSTWRPTGRSTSSTGLAARQLLDMGVSRFALSPEDGLENIRRCWRSSARRAVLIVYQDTPMFLAESCAYANLIGGCPGKANCKFESMEMVSSHGEKVTALDYHCRTIVLNQGPFCLSRRLKDLAAAGAVSLRADFVYRPYAAGGGASSAGARCGPGAAVPGGHAANFDRGVL